MNKETKAYMRNEINGAFSFIELLDWTSQNLNWSKGRFARYSKPEQILEQGKGKCEEFAIIYGLLNVENDPVKAVDSILAHIEKKRKKIGI